MLVAGTDVGAATAKTVIVSDGEILGFAIVPTGHSVPVAAELATRLALEKAGLWRKDFNFNKDFDYVVSTGYGRNSIPFAGKAMTEIICHARGAHHLLPHTRTIIDIGGQDCKVIGVDEKGNVTNFVMNDKCAAGTGRFVEVMAEVLEVPLAKFGEVALTSRSPCRLSNTCTIFAESEVVSFRAEGRPREDLIAGVCASIASRVAIMGRAVGYRKELVLTGGGAKNAGTKKFLQDETRMEILVPEEPQIMGALGAALTAYVELRKR